MLRIAVRNKTLGPVFLDVQDLSLSLTFEFGDIANIGQNKAPHSLSFTLPFTTQNDLAFAGFRDLSSIDIDIRESLDCTVYEGANVVLQGVINVMSIDLQARKYKCVVYGKAADVYDKLRDARWVDIFTNSDGTIFQGMDHDKTAVNILSLYQGQDITQGQVGARVLFYPFQNTGLQRVNTSGQIEYRALTHEALTNLAYQTAYYGKWTAKSHNPGIQVEYLLKKILQYCGLRLVINYVFDTAEQGIPSFEDMYYMTNTPNQKYRPYYGSDIQPLFFFVLDDFQFLTEIELSGSDFSQFAPLLTFVSTPDFDPDGLMTSDGFQAPTAGTYNFAFNFEWTRATGTFSDNFAIGVMPYSNTNGTQLSATVWTNQSASGANATGEGEVVFQVTLEANEEMSLRLNYSGISTVNPITIAAEDCRFRFLSYQGLSNTVVVPQSMGDESVGEWLEELMRRYNMTLTADADAGTATFQLRSKLYNTDTTDAKDWSDKVDRSKPVTLSSNTDDLKRKLIFQHSLGENAFDEYWDETYARPWDRLVWNSAKQYTKGEEVIGEYFNQAKWMRAPDGVADDGFTYDNDIQQSQKPKMLQMFRNLRLDAFWSVDPAGDNRFFVYRGAGNGLPLGFYYMFDNVDSEVPVAFNSHDPALPEVYGNLLSWNAKTSYQGLFSTNTSHGFFKDYYSQEVREKYSIDTRILDCEMYLTGTDLSGSTWGDIIRIDLQYYYLESIRDYYVGGNKAAKVRLRRLLTSDTSGTVVGAACTLGILSYDIDCFGVVTAYDRYGAELTFNEACCAQLGGGEWFFDENTSICSTGEPCDPPPTTSVGDAFRALNTGGSDFLFDPIQKSIDVRDGQVIVFTMTASTPASGNEFAINSVGNALLPLPQNCNVGFNVDYIATNTSDAARGDVEFGTWTGVVRGQDFVGDKAGADDQTSRIGDVTPLTVGVETHAVDGRLYARVFCGGMQGDWTLEVRATARIIEQDQDVQTVLHAEDSQPIKFQNGFYVGMNL